jgi:hypothetical protein
MRLEEWRLVVDGDFEHTSDNVVRVFQTLGFGVAPVESGDLPNAARPGEPHHYTLLYATLPELSFQNDGGSASMLGCRLSIYELTASRTLLTVDVRLMPYPTLALLVPRVKKRMREALARLAPDSSAVAAA